jgi:hypothetical protein
MMLPNKGMKQTKPAQAMELRSLSPVFDRLERVRDDERPGEKRLTGPWLTSAQS